MSAFDSHAQEEVGAFFEPGDMREQSHEQAVGHAPFTEHVDTTRAHAYLNAAISIQAHIAVRCTSMGYRLCLK